MSFLRVLILVGCIAWINALSFAASTAEPKAKIDESYADTGLEKHAKLILNGTVGYISTVTFTSEFKGFRLRPSTYTVEFSIQLGETSRVVQTSSNVAAGVALSTSAYTVGGWAVGNAWETRLLPAATGLVRYLYIKSTAPLVEILFEAF